MDPRFQKKYLAFKILHKLTNLTLKTEINEQINAKTSNKSPPKTYKNALIRPHCTYSIQLDRKSKDQLVHCHNLYTVSRRLCHYLQCFCFVIAYCLSSLSQKKEQLRGSNRYNQLIKVEKSKPIYSA